MCRRGNWPRTAASTSTLARRKRPTTSPSPCPPAASSLSHRTRRRQSMEYDGDVCTCCADRCSARLAQPAGAVDLCQWPPCEDCTECFALSPWPPRLEDVPNWAYEVSDVSDDVTVRSLRDNIVRFLAIPHIKDSLTRALAPYSATAKPDLAAVERCSKLHLTR
mmetsp:Transcript_779/g.2112  ORF Transcript_779/g.2112 Transcript_779/m.2112 type:complete len:164 (-) Transcript_779:64-555(-)